MFTPLRAGQQRIHERFISIRRRVLDKPFNNFRSGWQSRNIQTHAPRKDAPVGFKEIRLRFELDTDASDDQLATLQKLTERYCVVYQTLTTPPPIAVTSRVG